MKKQYFITGIGTDVGKTLVSAVLTEKLAADYWKPVQAGDLENSDSIKIKSLISNPTTMIHPEVYRLTQPCSPHLAAKLDNTTIELDKFQLPVTENHLIVEGAGGLMVPLNNKHLVADLIKHLKLETILVIRDYLGSINHSLLSLNMLRHYSIPVKGVIFTGSANRESREYILGTGVTLLGEIPEMEKISKKTIAAMGDRLTL